MAIVKENIREKSALSPDTALFISIDTKPGVQTSVCQASSSLHSCSIETNNAVIRRKRCCFLDDFVSKPLCSKEE